MLLESVLGFLLEFRLTVLVEVVEVVVVEVVEAVEVDGLASKLVPGTKGTGAGGDKDCVLLKLTFSEFSVNWIDCLL